MEDLRLLIGRKEIAAYLGCHVDKRSRWIKFHALSCAPLPDKRLATSITLIDAWLQARWNVMRRRRREAALRQRAESAD